MIMRSRYYIAIVSALLIASSPAYAYLDPGTGSLLLQAIIGAIAMMMATGKLWWYRLKSLFSTAPEEELPNESTNNCTEENVSKDPSNHG